MRKLILVMALSVPFAAAQAGDMLSGSEIEDIVGGNTVAGTMFESGDYAEFYAEDGTIRGDGYTGKWMIDGDAMCFSYDESSVDCWNVTRSGDTINWVQDGEIGGDGMVSSGNPNNF